jgi:hypothetical protein
MIPISLCFVLWCVAAVLSSIHVKGRFYDKIYQLAEDEMIKKASDGKLINEKGDKIPYRRIYPMRSDLTPAAIGAVEQILYITAIVSNNIQLIGAWWLFKVAGKWKVWEQADTRVVFNMFLFGNGLSLVHALFWAVIIKPQIIINWLR